MVSHIQEGFQRTCDDCGGKLNPNDRCRCQDVFWEENLLDQSFTVRYKGKTHVFSYSDVMGHVNNYSTETPGDFFKNLIEEKEKQT